jgi:hypothetical protein
VAFYIQKSLAHGPIRFGVAPRREIGQIDSDAALSTGPKGEFARKSDEGFFFAGAPVSIGLPTLPTEKSISSTPFWSSLRPDGTPKRLGFLALIILGVLFVLLGFAVVANKGAQGWVEVILGAIMIGVPIALTAQERKKIREQEEKERVEREERERRHREMLKAYTDALEKLRAGVNDETLGLVRREREALELPYEIWSTVAKQTMLAIGFDALAKMGPARAKEIADLIRRAAEATGLNAEDEAAARQAVYRAAVWHLVADDRVGTSQQPILRQLQSGLGVEADQDSVLAQFDKLRGVTRHNLPKAQAPMPLQFREYGVLATSGQTLNVKRDKKARSETIVPAQNATVVVTNKRLIVDTKKHTEVALSKIDDVEVDADADVLTIRTADEKHPIRLRVPEPFYAAALIDMAASLDERPKGFQ